MDFLPKIEEEKKRDISNWTLECALKMSPQLISFFIFTLQL